MRSYFSLMRLRLIKLILLLNFSFLTIFTQGQFPCLKVIQKNNLLEISCLDDIELEARQLNWQFLSQRKKELIFQNLHFTSPVKGYALAFVTGNGEDKYFLKTNDSGVSWDYDPIIKQTYVAHMQSFGKDSILLLGKVFIDWYIYHRYRYFSKDGGATWSSVSTNMTLDPVVTHFVNFKTGYCVDVNNNFLLTTDGGITWVKQGEVPIGFKKELICLSGNDIFLLNDNALYRSSDSGKNWRKISLPIENGLSDICLKDQIGFITSKMGIIFKTEDGGETWAIANNKLYPDLFKIAMLNKDSVFAVGHLSTILFSADGGKSWQPQYANDRINLYDIDIYDPEHIMAAGLYGLLKFYPPLQLSGYEWEPGHLISSINDNKATGNSINDSWMGVSAKDSKGEGYFSNILVNVKSPALFISSDSIADKDARVQLHATTDAGSWSFVKDEFTNGAYHDIEKINQDTAFIGGQYDMYGIILKTTDGGENWAHCNQNIKYRIDDIEFAGSKVGYAGGYLGYLIKTVDGGDHWEELNSPTKEDIKSISFVDELTGYLAAEYGQIYKTTDGGKTWEYSYLPYDHAIKILFLNKQKGFLLHNYSGFLTTNDGGKTWQEVPHDKFVDILDLTFVNENVGYACGGLLGPFTYLKTVDSGKTWMQKTFPRWTSTNYRTVSFKDEHTGFIFNDLGEVITTGDGGQNWFILDTLKFNEPYIYGSYGFPINSFQFMNNNKAIGVGNGQIIEYQISREINYNWYPENEVDQPFTAHPKVPVNNSPIYEGSIFRNSSCTSSLRFEIPQLNVSAPTLAQTTISIYPQPATDQLFIESFNLSDFNDIKVFDMNGKVCFSITIQEKSSKIRIQPALSPGMYIVEIRGEKQTIREKVSFQ